MTTELTDEQIDCIAAKYSLPYSLHNFARELIEHDRAARGVPSAPDPSDPADIIAGALSISRGHAIEMMREAVIAAQQERKPMTDERLDAAVKAWFKAHIIAGPYPFNERMRAAINAFHGIKDTS